MSGDKKRLMDATVASTVLEMCKRLHSGGNKLAGEMENASSREIIKTRYSLFGFNQNSTKGIKNESPTSVACKLNHSLHPRAFFR
jgi:hypothetical protein